MTLTDDGGIPSSPRIWAIENDGTSPFLLLYIGTGVVGSNFHNGTAAAGCSVSRSFTRGDVIEIVFILNSDGSTRLVARVNGVAVSADSAAAPSGGLATAWDYPALVLNSRSNGDQKCTAIYQALKFVTQDNVVSALDGTGSGDEDIMAEMAGLWMSPDGLRVSNTV